MIIVFQPIQLNCITCFWTVPLIMATLYVGTLGRKLINRISVISINRKKCGLINAKYIGNMH